MRLENVKNILETVKPGTFTSILYETECPVRAKLAKQGIKVKKVTYMVARFKINYGAIKEVKQRNLEREQSGEVKVERANNYEPIVKNSLYHNTNTGKDYLNVYMTKKPHCKSTYYVFENDAWKMITFDYVKEADYLIDSYFKKSSDLISMFRVNVSNILSLNKKEA